MKVLKAPHNLTIDQISSAGEIHFENGIATVFTKEQARHLCENIPGYEVVEIAGMEAPTVGPAEEAPVTETAPETQEEIPAAMEKETPEEVHETIFANALDRVFKKAKAKVVREFGKQPSREALEALIEAEKSGRNRISMIAWLNELLSTAPDKEEETTLPGEPEPETGAELAEKPPETGAELEEKPREAGAEVEEKPPDEETKPMEEGGEGPPEPGIAEDDRPPDGQDDKPPESTDEELGVQEGTESTRIGGEESAAKEIVLPVIQDDIKVVRAFAIEHGISADGGKGAILERIYADQRFK